MVLASLLKLVEASLFKLPGKAWSSPRRLFKLINYLVHRTRNIAMYRFLRFREPIWCEFVGILWEMKVSAREARRLFEVLGAHFTRNIGTP